MKAVSIEQLKVGDYFTLLPLEEPKETQVYVRDEYNRSTRKYECYKFSNICAFREFKKGKKVYIDFYF